MIWTIKVSHDRRCYFQDLFLFETLIAVVVLKIFTLATIWCTRILEQLSHSSRILDMMFSGWLAYILILNDLNFYRTNAVSHIATEKYVLKLSLKFSCPQNTASIRDSISGIR